jgi:hypothetical protein
VKPSSHNRELGSAGYFCHKTSALLIRNAPYNHPSVRGTNLSTRCLRHPRGTQPCGLYSEVQTTLEGCALCTAHRGQADLASAVHTQSCQRKWAATAELEVARRLFMKAVTLSPLRIEVLCACPNQPSPSVMQPVSVIVNSNGRPGSAHVYDCCGFSKACAWFS